MTIRRRAIKNEQKQQRRQAILNVAWNMFQDMPHQAITINEVAERCGLAKGTVYLYFKTKEELFLAIQEQQFQEWLDAIDTELQTVETGTTIEQVATIISETLMQRPAMMRLLAILHSTIEHNIDYDVALHFKRMLHERLTQTGTLLERCLPFIPANDGPRILLHIYALIIGVQHLADPAPVIQRILAEPGMEQLAVNFADEFPKTLRTLLYGLEQEIKRNNL